MLLLWFVHFIINFDVILGDFSLFTCFVALFLNFLFSLVTIAVFRDINVISITS